MEEAMKNRIILILSILSAIFFIATIGSCNNAFRQKSARDKEMLTRLDLEEKMTKFSKEKAALVEKIKAVQKEFEEEKAANEATKKALAQEQLVNKSIKEELAKVTKLKEALEEDLKEALVAGKSTKSR
jgi:predicted RNase H-like nuclease (RuvC/YqgF family)